MLSDRTQNYCNDVMYTGCESTKIAHSHSHAKMAEIVLFCPFLTIFKIVFIHPLIYLTISKYSFIHYFQLQIVLFGGNDYFLCACVLYSMLYTLVVYINVLLFGSPDQLPVLQPPAPPTPPRASLHQAFHFHPTICGVLSSAFFFLPPQCKSVFLFPKLCDWRIGLVVATRS